MSSRRDLPAYRIALYKKEDSCGMTTQGEYFICFKSPGCAMNATEVTGVDSRNKLDIMRSIAEEE
jgi:hypothetical protein